MCHQCPTVGEFICSILSCGRCHNDCEKRPERRCERKCEREEKHYDCVCQAIKETESCHKAERECSCSKCPCKVY